MSSRPLLRPTAVVLASLLAWTIVVRAAAPIKDWKDGTTGKADDKTNWKDGVKPGNSDVARISNGKVIINEPAAAPLTILGLELSGTGILEGGGTLSLLGVSGLLSADSSWTGGDVDNVTINTSGSATFTIGAGSTKNLKNGAKLNLLGNTTWSGSDISTANGAQIANTGNFTVSGGGKIGHDTTVSGSRATFTNNGTFTKNTSADVTELESIFDNNGNLTVSTGTLKLKGGGTHASTGNITVATNATLAISDTNYTFNGGAIAGSGTLEFAGATTTFNGTSATNAHLKVSGGTTKFNQSHSTNGRLTLSSGVVDGASGTTTSVGGLDWTGGDITTTKVTTNGTNTIGNGAAKRLLNSAQLTLGGNTLWDGSAIETTDSTSILNQSSVTFTASGDGSLAYSGTGTRAVFTNNGTFTKDAGGTAGTEVQTKFDNNGTVNANGRLRLVGGGTNTGSFNIGSDATVTIADNDYTFNGGTLTGAGTLELTGATTTFNGTTGSADLRVRGGTATFSGTHTTSGTLRLESGNIEGNGTATVDTFEWSGGSLNGKVKATGNATLAGAKTIGRSAELTISGTLTTNGTLTNEGKFIKQGAGSTNLTTTLDSTSSGTLAIDEGTLTLAGGGKASNHVTIATGAKLQIGTTNYTFENATVTAAGTGELELVGALTKFKDSTGSGKVSVNGGDLDFDGTQSTLGTLSLVAGNVSTSNGTATVSSLTWAGGKLSGKVKATDNITLTGAKTLDSAAELTVAGTFSSDAALTNNGKFIKQGTATTDIATTLDSTGTLSADAGALKLSGGGKSSNIVTIGNDAKIQVATNSYTFENATITGTGTGQLELTSSDTKFKNSTSSAKISVNGGNLDFEGTATVGTLALAAGNVTTTGATVADVTALDWSGGGLNGKVKANATTLSGGAKTIGASGELIINGTFTTTGVSTITNQGKFTKNGTGVTDLATVFDSTGTLAADSGTLKLSGGGKTSGTVTIGSSGKLDVASAYTFENATLSGAGDIELTSSTTKFKNSNSSAKISVNGGNLELEGTTTLGALALAAGNITTTGTGTADVSSLDWSGGNLDGKIKSNATSLSAGAKTIGSSGELTINGTFTANSATTLTNQGKFNKTGGGVTDLGIVFDSTGTLAADSGTLRLSGGGKASGNVTVGSTGKLDVASAYTFENATLSGAGDIELTSSTTKFKNSNSSAKVSVNGGNLDFEGTATLGTLALSAGNVTTTGATVADVTSLDWSGGSLNGKVKANAAAVSGGAKTIGSSGELTISGTFTTSGTSILTNQGKFTKNGSGLTDLGTVFDSTGTLAADSGTLKLSGGGKASGNVTVGSTGKLDVASVYTFENATLSGAGDIELTASTTKFKNSNSSAKVSVNGGNLDFEGTATVGTLALSAGNVTTTGATVADVTALDWSGGSLNGKVKANAAAVSGGAKTIGSSGELTISGTFTTTGTSTLTNHGKFTKNGSGITELATVFDNTGTLSADLGTLKLSGGGKASGNVNVANSGKLQIHGANYTFENAVFSGSGTLELEGATTRFKGNSGAVKLSLSGGNADLDTSELAASQLLLSDGSVNSLNGGSADVGALAWSGGTLNAKVKTAGAHLNGSDKTLSSGADLTLGGLTTWDGTLIQAHGNARVRNAASATFQATDGLFANSGTATFTNDGTLAKSQGNGSLVFQTRFENNGTVNVDSGKLHLTGGGRNADNASILIKASSELLIDGNLELAANSALSGDGLGRLLSGTLTAHGNVRLKNFSFEGGSLAGSNTFYGAVDWKGGNWNSDIAGVTTTIAAGGSLDLRSNSNHDFSNRSILNYGTVNWHSGNLRGANGSAFVNHSIFNDLNAGTKSLAASSGSASFINNGEYRKSQGGTTNVDLPFTNNGTIKVTSGSLVFNSTFTNNGAFNLANGASAKFSAPLTFGINKALTGVGTIDAPHVTAAGEVAPGASPGALAITGNLTLLSTSTLLIELGGPGQGTDYDFLSVGGFGLLDGKLNVSFVNGYQWSLPAGATFTILTANGGLSGAFLNVANGGRLATTDGAATFQVNYGLGASLTNSVVLSNFVVAVPEPSTYALLALGSLIVLFSVRRRGRN